MMKFGFKFCNHMDRRFHVSFWARGIIISVTLANLGIHAYLGSYSRFIADDYCSAAEVNKLGVFRAAWFWYITWTGRYSANLLDAIFGALGPDFTPAVTSLVVLTWLTALGVAISLLLQNREKRKHPLISAVLATTILFLTLTLTPNVRQSLYWSQGMRSVVSPLIIGTCYIFIFRWFQSRTWSGKTLAIWLMFSLILSYGAGGFSETYTVFQLSAFLLAIGVFLLLKKHVTQINSFLFLISGFLGAILSFLTVVKAPGNLYRQTLFPPTPAFFQLAAIAFRSFGIYWLGLFGSTEKILGLAAAIAIGILISALVESKPVKTQTPIWILVLGLGLIFSCFPPSAYGLSDAPPDRTLIIPTYGLMITLAAFGFSLGHLLTQRKRVEQLASMASALLILAIGAISSYQMISTRQIFINYAAAWEKFHTQMLNYQQAGIKNVEISTQEMNANNWAGLDVLGDNPKFWLNECVSEYYGVKVISNSPRP